MKVRIAILRAGDKKPDYREYEDEVSGRWIVSNPYVQLVQAQALYWAVQYTPCIVRIEVQPDTKNGYQYWHYAGSIVVTEHHFETSACYTNDESGLPVVEPQEVISLTP